MGQLATITGGLNAAEGKARVRYGHAVDGCVSCFKACRERLAGRKVRSPHRAAEAVDAVVGEPKSFRAVSGSEKRYGRAEHLLFEYRHARANVIEDRRLVVKARQVRSDPAYQDLRALGTIPGVSVHPFRSNPYTDSGVSVHLGRRSEAAGMT